MIKREKHTYDKEYCTYEELLDILKSRNLIIQDDLRATHILKSASYYDLVNGYKECFMHESPVKSNPNLTVEKFNSETSIENLYTFYWLDRGVQNVLFKYSAHIENYLKNILSDIIAQNISVDDHEYLNPKFYFKNIKSLKTTTVTGFKLGGQYWTWTSDLMHVKHAL